MSVIKKTVSFVPLMAASLVVSALLILGCRGSSKKGVAHQIERPNIFLIVFDALRADRLGVYGAPGNITPNIDRFARTAMVYRRAFAQSSWTKTSVASLVTGVYPYRHGVLEESIQEGTLPSAAMTLAERLREKKYRTAAFAMNPHISTVSGFDQGFDKFVYESDWEKNTTKTATDSLLGYLKTVDREHSQFVFIHYLDPHDPWPRRKVCDRFLAGISKEGINKHVIKGLPINVSGELRIKNLGKKAVLPEPDELSQKEVAYMVGLYNCEVSLIDKAFGEIFDHLERNDWLKNSLLILTSDHGEEFLDHGMLRHGYQLYDETIRVPLIIRAPDAVAVDKKAAKEIVELVDIAPTIYHVAGIENPAKGLDGAVLPGFGVAPKIDGPRHAFGMTKFRKQHRAFLIDGENKLIHDFNENACQMFDLKSDPREDNPTSCSSSGEGEKMFSRLVAKKQAGERESLPKQESDVNREQSETLKNQLKALGYVQ